MKIAILQARVSSSRLPRKVLKILKGKPMLLHQIERVAQSKRIDQLYVATSNLAEDDEIEDLCNQNGINCFRGSLSDVLDRYYQLSSILQPSHIVRLTGDCPLIDHKIIDNVIDFHIKGNYDYTSNAQPPTFPDGMDVEVMRYGVLKQAWSDAKLKSQREHVTLYIYQKMKNIKIGRYTSLIDYSNMRWTVDELNDFRFVERVYDELYDANHLFDMDSIIDLISNNPDIMKINQGINRNEGLKKSLKNDKVYTISR